MKQDLVKNIFAGWDDQADFEIPRGISQIYLGIAEDLARSDDHNVLRGSAATMCVRRRWYQHHRYPAKPLTPRKILNFTSGDITERVMAYFVGKYCVGPDKIYHEVNFGRVIGHLKIQGKDIPIHDQLESSFLISTKYGPRRVNCHFDGMGLRHDGLWELIEFKSAADYGFKKFQESGPEDYLKQAHAYMLTEKMVAMRAKITRFFFFRKNTGHIWEGAFAYDEGIARSVYAEFLTSIGQEIPQEPYPVVVKKGKKTIAWQCQYCSFLETCKGKHKIEWKRDQWGNQKPSYIFD